MLGRSLDSPQTKRSWVTSGTRKNPPMSVKAERVFQQQLDVYDSYRLFSC